MKKLVRDSIPKKCDGKFTKISDKDQLISYFVEKLREEVEEVKEANNDGEKIEELCDVMQVCIDFANLLGLSQGELTRKRFNKCLKRGGFTKGIIME